ncbi:MAG: cupredoxin domain-containing protein [Hyphomicrobiales bacterium]
MTRTKHPQKKTLRPESNAVKTAPDRNRRIIFGVLSASVLAVAAYFLWPALKLSGLFTPAGTEVVVAISMSGFSPARIEVREGQPLTIRLVNKDNRYHKDGGGWHQFAIDDLGLDVRVAPLKTKTFTLTPTKSGVFDFYCGVCCGGKANPYMHGALTVTT